MTQAERDFVAEDNEIFVFGSNLSGIHGAGAAAHARKHYGAILGKGIGPQGQSYAIPTKDYDVDTSLTLGQVDQYIIQFLQYARDNPGLRFRLTAIGCGLAGFTVEQIAPLLCNAPNNVRFPPEFRSLLSGLKRDRFWSYAEFR
jgi:hypothetical protein